jgi:hypothetical protein
MSVELHLSSHEIVSIVERLGQADISKRWTGRAGAPNLTAAKRWIDSIWNTITLAVKDVAAKGNAVIQTWVDNVQTEVRQMFTELGDTASDVIDYIKHELAELQRRLCEAAIGLLPATLKIRDKEVPINDVTVDYEIQIESGIEASVACALKMVASGKMTVSAKYASAH